MLNSEFVEELLVFLGSHLVNKKQKNTPRAFACLVPNRLNQTKKGETILSGAVGDEGSMRANDSNTREFELSELRDANQFKAAFGMSHEALQKQIDKARQGTKTRG